MALTTDVHGRLRAFILSDRFPCVGAKSALRTGAYRFGLYSTLGSRDAAADLADDLSAFIGELPSLGAPMVTYLASFCGPQRREELAFEHDLWATLQALHDLDAPHHAWDPSVSSDPSDPRFSFSFGGTALFVVGLHPASSRAARRFAWPTLVFNPHHQFEELRERGLYAQFQRVIRRGEERLQGGVNPMLADFGVQSEAAQYSGRRVDSDWRCPLHVHHRDDPATD